MRCFIKTTSTVAQLFIITVSSLLMASRLPEFMHRPSPRLAVLHSLEAYLMCDLGSGTFAVNTGSNHSEWAPHTPITDCEKDTGLERVPLGGQRRFYLNGSMCPREKEHEKRTSHFLTSVLVKSEPFCRLKRRHPKCQSKRKRLPPGKCYENFSSNFELYKSQSWCFVGILFICLFVCPDDNLVFGSQSVRGKQVGAGRALWL